MAAPFKLAQTLLGHAQDVKAVAAATDDIIVSASRDGSARQWSLTQKECTATYSASQQPPHPFVNAVYTARIQGSDYILTAGADSTISAWLPLSASKEPEYMLLGHSSNVCCLSVVGETIISGSWDKSVRIWKDWQCVATLDGHEQAVWDVAALHDGRALITACADNLVRLYSDFSKDHAIPNKIYRGHTQPVRALVVLNNESFASAGNDGTIRLWNIASGQQSRQFDGHDSFVYSLALLPSGDIASSGEDRTIRVWNAENGNLAQTITLPAISVWSVAVLPNGDIVSGASDGAVRVFTRATERFADATTLKEYDATIAGSSINSNQIGDVKKTDLPGPEVLLRPGNKEGQVIMVKQSDGSVEAHQWSFTAREWAKIGTVVDAVGSGRKQLYQGQEYDFVFDVDIKDGAPPLKLPYNAAQNPYDAAQKFLLANELPLDYVDQVVKFIEKNTGGIAIGTSAGSDPFTGGSSYRPGQPSQQPQQPAQQPSLKPATGSNFPLRQHSFFPQANLAAMLNKVGQLNEQLAADLNPASLDQNNLKQLDSLVAALETAQKSPPGPRGAKLPTETMDIVLLLLEWPATLRFPAIDLCRVALLYNAPTPAVLRSLLGNLGKTGKEGETNSMLALRAVANAFGTRKGELALKENASDIVPALRAGRAQLNKLGRIALATIAMNLSVLGVKQDLDKSVGGAFVDLLAEILNEEEPEALYRALFATGNLLLSPNVIGATSTSTVEKLRSLAVSRAAASTESRLQSLGEEIKTLRVAQTY